MLFKIEVFDTDKKCVVREVVNYKRWCYAEKRAERIAVQLEMIGTKIYKFDVTRIHTDREGNL